MGTDWTAIQFTSALPSDPSPYSETQVVNRLLSSDSTQIEPPFPTVGLLVEWANEANTLTSFPPVKGCAKVIVLQANSPGLNVVILTFPAWNVTPVNGGDRVRTK